MPRRGGRTVYDYVKAIYILGGRPGGDYVPIHRLARLLGVRRATVAVMAKRLELQGLVERASRRGLRLTARGAEELAKLAWKVGVVENLLSRAGVSGSLLEELARKLACRLSDDDAEHLCASLGHPTMCPHGYPIPHPCEGKLSLEGTCLLRH